MWVLDCGTARGSEPDARGQDAWCVSHPSARSPSRHSLQESGRLVLAISVEYVRAPPPAAPLASGPEVFRCIRRRDRGAAATHQDCHGQAQEDHSTPRNGRHHANQLTGHVAEPTLTATGCLPARPAFGPKGMSRPLEAAPSGSRLLLLPLEQSAGTAEPHSRRR